MPRVVLYLFRELFTALQLKKLRLSTVFSEENPLNEDVAPYIKLSV